MPKTPVTINFSQGMNQKADPWQIPIGQFESLKNMVFSKAGLLQKANGYQQVSTLPNTTYNYLTTFNGDLTAIGPNIAAYNPGNNNWVQKGAIAPLSLSTLPLVRNSLNQTQADSAIAPNGAICTVYTEVNSGTSSYKYVIADSVTGQNLVAPTLIPAASGGTITGAPRVFLLGNYFVLIFTNVITAVSHLQYISISYNNFSVITTPQDISASYISATTLSWGGVSFNDRLYIAYNTTSGGQSIHITYLSTTAASLGQTPATATILAGSKATMVTMCVDQTISNPLIYISFYDAGGSTGYTAAVDVNLTTFLAATQIIASGTILNLASAAMGGRVLVFEEVSNNYSYDSGIPTHYVQAVTCTSAGVVGTPYVVARSIGLGSKAFIYNRVIYFMGAYQSTYQNSYFLMNGSTSVAAAPIVVAKLAWENGGGYLTTGLPTATVSGVLVYCPYLFKDLIQPLAVANTPQQTLNTGAGVYSQTGINLVTFNFTQNIQTQEIASSLNISGGFHGTYDGYSVVENNFFLYPENVEVTTATGSGSIAADQYYYQAIYQWTDNQGNAQMSAASIPVTITTTTASSTNTIKIPTLRLTYKTANPVKILLYRWGTLQPVYYQVTSLTAPTLNSTTSDSVSITDTFSNAQILGNSIIYTNGLVAENVAAPSFSISTLWDTRFWIVDAEDPNTLWFSKTVIEAVPVEMSDLLTYYVAPNTGTVSSTGPITALAPLDSYLIIFKANAIYWISGSGPDNTGSGSTYSASPTYITSSVGCSDPSSIVISPDGIMFQSDKGIWLLNHSLQTSYIGAPVEDLSFQGTVNSAVTPPATNQVRQTLSTGQTLMFDYYFGQWGTFTGSPAISSCIYSELHSYMSNGGAVYQETPGAYMNGQNPVLQSFVTGWINVAGLQGFERFYYMTFLGRFLSPCQILVQIAYDYVNTPRQSNIITPKNYSSIVPSPYGDQPAPFGSSPDVMNWEVHARKQKTQAFKIYLSELYDPSQGGSPGAGFTLSAIKLFVSLKNAKLPINSANTVG